MQAGIGVDLGLSLREPSRLPLLGDQVIEGGIIVVGAPGELHPVLLEVVPDRERLRFRTPSLAGRADLPGLGASITRVGSNPATGKVIYG